MYNRIENNVLINASLNDVWEHLTKPGLMKQWMGDAEMNVEIITDWVVGNPILIKAFHHVKFENKGVILQFEPQKVIQYTHLDSISGLPDKPENYSIITFRVMPQVGQISLTVTAENFPTEAIYKHFEFYWRGTITIIKNVTEQKRNA